MHSLKTKFIALFLAVFTAFSCVAAEVTEQGVTPENAANTQTASDSDTSSEADKADNAENCRRNRKRFCRQGRRRGG